MVNIRPFTENDVPALQAGIARDEFHPGEWKVEHFWDKEQAGPPAHTLVNVIEDGNGPIVFVRYTASLRISVVWNDGGDVQRNARSIIQGLRNAVTKAREGGFTEIIITTSHPKLADFFTKVIKMERSGDEYILSV